MKRPIIISALLLGCLTLAAHPGTLRAQVGMSPRRSATLHFILDSTRSRYKLPALAAAVIVDGQVIALDAVGVRKAGDTTQVTVDDRWHLGSCTKAMTATMIARLVEAGKLQWTTTIGEAFPELRKKMRKEYRGVTLEMLLAHRGGLPAETFPKGIWFDRVRALPGDERAQREAYVGMILAVKPDARPGTTYIYSNAGYVIAGAMAERATGTSYDTLMRTLLFAPLGITRFGFGPTNTPGQVDQPWAHFSVPHRAIVSNTQGPKLEISIAETPDSASQAAGKPYGGYPMAGGGSVPYDASPLSDNPPAISPAGRVNMSIGDWGKFVIAHLDGEARGGILNPATFKRLHTPPAGGEYAGGWSVVSRSWAGGNALTHAGSNNLNYAVVWAAPRKRFAVVICTNVADESTPTACDEVAGAILQAYLLTK